MKLIFSFLFLLSLFSCFQQEIPFPAELEPLRREVLEKANACSAELAEFYNKHIWTQNQVLSVQQMKNSLENMKDNINCGGRR